MSDREAVKLLHKEMAGWTIEGIKPSSYAESLAEFHLYRERKIKAVVVCATDLTEIERPIERKVVLVCATDLGAWIQDVYDPAKPDERMLQSGTTFEQLVSHIWDYLLENDCWGNVDPETDEDLPEPSEYLVVCDDLRGVPNLHGFKAPSTGRIWWLTEAMIKAFEILCTPEGRAKVAYLIATETPVDVFRALETP